MAEESGFACHILCASPLFAEGQGIFYAIRPLILWRLFGAISLANMGVGVVELVSVELQTRVCDTSEYTHEDGPPICMSYFTQFMRSLWVELLGDLHTPPSCADLYDMLLVM